jgi:tRNA(adenine34) deaminase
MSKRNSNNKNIFTPEQEIFFMNQALECAQEAFDENEVPVGAVVVDGNTTIVGRGHNNVMARKTQAAHAEIIALEQAGINQGDWRLEHCWLFVTLEPCAMCMNMIILSRLAGVIYGAQSPLFGYSTTFPLDNIHEFPVYRKDALVVIAGVQSERSVTILQKFFNQKRNSSGSA